MHFYKLPRHLQRHERTAGKESSFLHLSELCLSGREQPPNPTCCTPRYAAGRYVNIYNHKLCSKTTVGLDFCYKPFYRISTGDTAKRIKLKIPPQLPLC